MIKAIIFDFYGVLEANGEANSKLFDYLSNSLKKSYKLAVISNSGGEAFNSLLSGEQRDLFDEITLSGKLAFMKPQPEIYHYCMEKLKLKVDEAVFIDDSLGHCVGAQQAGMKAINYQDFQKLKTELEKLLSTPDN